MSAPRLYQRKSGIWVIRWREDGHAQWVSCKTKDKKTAEIMLGRFLAKRGDAPGATVTGREALEGFFASLRLDGASPATVLYYEKKLRPLVTEWEGLLMASWSRVRLQAYLSKQKEERSWSPRSVQMVISACKRFRDWAQDCGYTCPDFIGKMKGPAVSPPDREVLKRTEIEALLREVREHTYLELPIALAAYTGMAIGDIRDLQWSEVDLDARMIVRARKKTTRPIRIPIVPPLLDVLLRNRAISGAVCRGMPEKENSALQALWRAQLRAGIPKAPRGQNGWHRFRHSIATLLMEHGVAEPVIAQILAHSPGSVVTKRYQHPDDTLTREAMERIWPEQA